MRELIVGTFEDEFKAEQVRLDLMRMQHKHLVDLQEAAVACIHRDGSVRLHHVQHFTVPGVLTGGFVGTLTGLMVFNPVLALFGMIAGAGFGAVLGALKEVGISEEFMKDLASHLKPGTSALFILVKKARPEQVVEELKKFNGKILQTSLYHDDEAKLRAVLDSVTQGSDRDSPKKHPES